ncbi:MAG: LptF/LptG family permease [Candidatus Competibacteraceae bacterium]|nr:LptF/LptG family permease [Candidatus Competibacteraceae bacterium]
MKKLTIMVVRSYFGPFILTFFISLFVLVMQFLWKYIDQLVGKGLEITIILELLFYASATLVPMALPLAILLSSIMTMGALAENLELVAAKASGISLLGLMKPLIILSSLISFTAFLFANYGMPIANYKLKSLLFSIQRTRPAIDIPESAFYDGIKGLEIYIRKKEDDGKTFQDVLIYDHSKDMYGASSVTMARRGALSMSDDGRFLVLRLHQGMRIDDRNFFTKEREGLPLYREVFAEQQVFFDLSGSKFNRDNEGLVKNQYSMMNVSQLNQVNRELLNDLNQTHTQATILMQYLSSISTQHQTQEEQIGAAPDIRDIGMLELMPDAQTNQSKDSTPTHVSFSKNQFLSSYNEEQTHLIKTSARQSAEEIRSKIEEHKSVVKGKQSQIAKNRVEFHRKYSLSIACLILFFVGAPLGAIIRKGGLGLPLIFCIVIFIVYYVISTIGEKSVKQLALSPFWGMWLSTFILFPFGLFLTLKASTDSPIFMAETYIRLLKRIAGKK